MKKLETVNQIFKGAIVCYSPEFDYYVLYLGRDSLCISNHFYYSEYYDFIQSDCPSKNGLIKICKL